MTPTSAPETDQPIVIFDGVCNFCNGAINFIVKHEADTHYVFAPSQGETGKALLEKHGLTDAAVETVVLVDGDNVLVKSDAALAILRTLKTVWKVLLIGRIIPRPIRDALYTYFSRHRYRIFGKLDQCIRPSPEIRERFLE